MMDVMQGQTSSDSSSDSDAQSVDEELNQPRSDRQLLQLEQQDEMEHLRDEPLAPNVDELHSARTVW